MTEMDYLIFLDISLFKKTKQYLEVNRLHMHCSVKVQITQSVSFYVPWFE